MAFLAHRGGAQIEPCHLPLIGPIGSSTLYQQDFPRSILYFLVLNWTQWIVLDPENMASENRIPLKKYWIIKAFHGNFTVKSTLCIHFFLSHPCTSYHNIIISLYILYIYPCLYIIIYIFKAHPCTNTLFIYFIIS